MTNSGRLRVAKLRAVGERHLGFDPGEVTAGRPFSDGAGLIVSDRAAVLVGRPSRRSLGPALMWAAKAVQRGDTGSSDDTGQSPATGESAEHGAVQLARLDLVLDLSLPVDGAAPVGGRVDASEAVEARLGPMASSAAEPDHADRSDYAELPIAVGHSAPVTAFGLPVDDPRVVAGQLARIGGLFRPEVHVWLVEGTEVNKIDASALPPGAPPPWEAAAEQVQLLADAGLELSGEPGMILGEVAGLEVARATVVDGEDRLDIGVGRFDQELSAVAQADLPRHEALQRAADLVRLTRTPENGAHPMTRLARERWLRTHLLADPGLVGAAELSAAPGLWVRDGLRNPAPAAAVGTDVFGEPMVVVCSAGVDTDLIPAALELFDAFTAESGKAATLVVALPAADVMVGTERVAHLAVRPVRLVGLMPPWETNTARR